MTALAIALDIVAALMLVPALMLLIEVLAAVLPPRKSKPLDGPRPSIAVLIPAHNEAAGIISTIASVKPQLLGDDRIVVVSDNCTDNTAEVARAAGAEVVERNDAQRRGKGYAIDFGVRHLAAAPPDVVVMLDADCIASDGCIDRLARECHALKRPVQALDLMICPIREGRSMQVAEFAWRVKNLVRPLGLHRLGLPCQLMGTGMAFPWVLISQLPTATALIVEDLHFGLETARRGYAPVFSPSAAVHSFFSTSTAGARQQRIRWEHGHLAAIMTSAIGLILQGLSRRNWSLLALALDLCVPPLALMTLLSVGLLCVCFIGDFFAASLLAATSVTCIGAAGFVAWLTFGRGVISLPTLAYAPFYVVAKIPLYITFLVKRQSDWVRSSRDFE